jgi:hypothetical protein
MVREALGQVFSEYFGFPCHSFIPLVAPQTSPFRAGKIGKLMDAAIVDLVLLQPQKCAHFHHSAISSSLLSLPISISL